MIGVAVGPIPLVGLILILFSGHAVRNSLAYLGGFVVGLFAIGALVLAVGFEASGGGEADSGGLGKVVVGVMLLGLAVKKWRSRPAPGAETELPGWMSSIGEASTGRALGLGLLMALANPKNLGLMFAAASSVSGAGLSRSDEIGALAVLVLIGSSTMVALVLANLVAGERAVPALESARDWLTANNSTVMTVLFVVLGAKVLGDGLSVLL